MQQGAFKDTFLHPILACFKFLFWMKATLRCSVIKSSSPSDFDILRLMEGLKAETPKDYSELFGCTHPSSLPSQFFIMLHLPHCPPHELSEPRSISLTLCSFLSPKFYLKWAKLAGQKRLHYMWLKLHHSRTENRCRTDDLIQKRRISPLQFSNNRLEYLEQ